MPDEHLFPSIEDIARRAIDAAVETLPPHFRLAVLFAFTDGAPEKPNGLAWVSQVTRESSISVVLEWLAQQVHAGYGDVVRRCADHWFQSPMPAGPFDPHAPAPAKAASETLFGFPVVEDLTVPAGIVELRAAKLDEQKVPPVGQCSTQVHIETRPHGCAVTVEMRMLRPFGNSTVELGVALAAVARELHKRGLDVRAMLSDLPEPLQGDGEGG